MEIRNRKVFLIGAKGTGLSNLAVVLKKAGADVSGCDSGDVFPTDGILKRFGIPVARGFGEELLKPPLDLVIHSSAYKPTSCPILKKALAILPKGTFSYPGFIARLSEEIPLYAVAGTHGKTTTTAAAAFLLSRPSRSRFPFFALFGSTVAGEEPVLQGTGNMVVEACEYQNHFLLYKTRGALITSAEMDHPDFFKDEDEVLRSFQNFVAGIERGGFLILDLDGANVGRLASFARAERRDLNIVEYGFSAPRPFCLRKGQSGGTLSIGLLPGREFRLPSSEPHIAGDYVGAALLASLVLLDRPCPELYLKEGWGVCDEVLCSLVGLMLHEMQAFPGVAGRCETLFEEDGVVYVKDYAHHPSEIAVCLAELRARSGGRRICVLFCPHTYSRTEALMDGFVSALSQAEIVVVQKTYPSARGEAAAEDNAKVLARRLEKLVQRPPFGRLERAVYIEYDEKAAAFAAERLEGGGVCLALGAGNNSGLLEMVRRLRRGKAN